MNTTNEATDRTINILLSRKDHVEAGLAAIAKRCARKGLTVISWTWGKPFEEKRKTFDLNGRLLDEKRWEIVERIPVTIPCEVPKYAGWSFLATLQHLDGENIVRAISDDVPAVYRTRGPMCDHCHSMRKRNDTYVLRHEDGRTMQVGSSCLGDFLGFDRAGSLAEWASMLAEIREMLEDDYAGEDSGEGERAYVLTRYLAYVALAIRENGWVSRKMANEDVLGRTRATSGVAATLLYIDKKERTHSVSEEDVSLGERAAEWAESLSDDAIAKETSDYLHNCRAIARSGLVDFRSQGIAASIVVAYQKAIGEERKRRERPVIADVHVGTVGKREEWQVTLDFVHGYETDYGYTTILKFRTNEGAAIVWKASNTDLSREDVGKAFKLKGTVKAHDEYKGAKQTLVSRCKVA